MKVSILGGGSFGSALAQVLFDNGNDINVWCHDQESVEKFLSNDNTYIDEDIKKQINVTTDISCVKDTKFVVIVVPMFALRTSIKLAKEYLNDDSILVLCSKGLEQSTLKTGHDVIEEEVPNVHFSILSGPTHAEEVAQRMFTSIVATSEDINIAIEVQHLFNNKYFRVYVNTDIKGVELAGAVKNILAIAAGYCDASDKFGDNTKAMMMTRGLRELKILTKMCGGTSETVYGLTGVGDLMVTAFSKHSRNRKFGELLGKGLSVEEAKREVGMVVEGYYSLQAIHQLIEENNLDLPVIELIYNAVYHEADVDELYNIASSRSLKHEGE